MKKKMKLALLCLCVNKLQSLSPFNKYANNSNVNNNIVPNDQRFQQYPNNANFEAQYSNINNNVRPNYQNVQQYTNDINLGPQYQQNITNHIPSLNTIQTTYVDTAQPIYENLYVSNHTPTQTQVTQEQLNLDNLKGKIHHEIEIHKNELSFIEEQIKVAQSQQKENASEKNNKKILNDILKQLNKQKKLTISILNNSLKQEQKITQRQQELYNLVNFTKKYVEDGVTKIKSNQKISREDRDSIRKIIIENNPKIMILVKPSKKRHNSFNQQGSIIDAEQIKSNNNYMQEAKYITDNKCLASVEGELNHKFDNISNQINQIKIELKLASKTDKAYLENEKERLQSELKRIKSEQEALKTREIELEKFGNFHFRYTTSFNGSIPSEIRTNQELNPQILSRLSIIFSKYDNLNLLIKPKRSMFS